MPSRFSRISLGNLTAVFTNTSWRELNCCSAYAASCKPPTSVINCSVPETSLIRAVHDARCSLQGILPSRVCSPSCSHCMISPLADFHCPSSQEAANRLGWGFADGFPAIVAGISCWWRPPSCIVFRRRASARWALTVSRRSSAVFASSICKASTATRGEFARCPSSWRSTARASTTAITVISSKAAAIDRLRTVDRRLRRRWPSSRCSSLRHARGDGAAPAWRCCSRKRSNRSFLRFVISS